MRGPSRLAILLIQAETLVQVRYNGLYFGTVELLLRAQDDLLPSKRESFPCTFLS